VGPKSRSGRGGEGFAETGLQGPTEIQFIREEVKGGVSVL
jgi:hypothetical protein